MLGVAPHSLRAVTPEELGQVVRLPRADGADPHPRGRADARGRRLLRVEPPASGRMAGHAGPRGRALVPRARDAHDGTRGGGARGHRRRRRPRADDGSRPGRRNVPGCRVPGRQWPLRHRQRFEHADFPVPGAAPARVVAADARAPAQRAAGGGRRDHRRVAVDGGRARRRAGARAGDRNDRGRPARRSCRPRRGRSGAGRPGPPRRPRCRDLRAVEPSRARRAWPAAVTSSATGATRRRTPCSRAIAPRSRGSRGRHDARAFRPAARRRASRDAARGCGRLRRDPRRRGRHRRRHDRMGRPARRPAARCRRRDHAGVRWRMDHAGTRRLPHPSRLRGQSLRRVRAPARWAPPTPTSRAGRGHRRHRARDARGGRRRAGRAKPAAHGRARGRRRHDGRSQVGLWPRHGGRS